MSGLIILSVYATKDTIGKYIVKIMELTVHMVKDLWGCHHLIQTKNEARVLSLQCALVVVKYIFCHKYLLYYTFMFS